MTNRPNNEAIISIIVPVYKSEQYICRCIDSILNQTFTHFELLLVDDGSPDQSGRICDDYARKDKRIKVIHKNNGGVSSARQAGLDEAIGEFVIHADPDDWVEEKWLESLYKTIISEDADLVICDFFKEYKNGPYYSSQAPTSLAPSQIIKDYLSGKNWSSLCNALVRMNVIRKHEISFIHGMDLWEDLYFIVSVLLHNVRVAYVNKALYHYDMHINNNSIVRHPSMAQVYSQMKVIDYLDSVLPQDLASFLYKKKVLAKYRCFETGIENNKFMQEMYNDINERIIQENGFKFQYIMKYKNDEYSLKMLCVVYCLKGHERFAHYLFSFWNRYIKGKEFKKALRYIGIK